VLFGPHIAAGKLPGARLVDIALTVANWLGLPLPNVEGTPLQAGMSAVRPTETP
jgi:hypothetical protein